MFKLTAEFNTLEEFQEFAGKLLPVAPDEITESGMIIEKKTAKKATNVVKIAADVAEEKPKKKAKAKSKAKKVEPETPTDEALSVEEDSTPLDYTKDVRPTAVKLTKLEGGRDVLVKIFDSLGVVDSTELDEGQLPAFLAEVEKYIVALTPADEE